MKRAQGRWECGRRVAVCAEVGAAAAAAGRRAACGAPTHRAGWRPPSQQLWRRRAVRMCADCAACHALERVDIKRHHRNQSRRTRSRSKQLCEKNFDLVGGHRPVRFVMMDADEQDADAAMARRLQAEEFGIAWGAAPALSMFAPGRPPMMQPNSYGRASSNNSFVSEDGRDMRRQLLVQNANAAVINVFSSGRFIAARLLFGFIELIFGVYSLVFDWGNLCNQPLQIWVMMFLLRTVLSFPLITTRYFAARNRNENLLAQVEGVENVANYLTFVWVSFGIYLLFSASHCNSTTPRLYAFVATIVALHIALSCSPVIFLFGFCLCLPCVLLVLRFFQPRQGMTSRELEGLEVRTYGDFPSDRNQSEVEDVEARPSCVICQNAYALGDRLRILPCKHEFHLDCVDQWLAVKATCPLCRHNLLREDSDALNADGVPAEEPHGQGSAEHSRSASNEALLRGMSAV